MCSECKILRRLALMGVVVLLAQAVRAQAQFVFSDSTTDLNLRFNPGINEVGDEIVLASDTGRYLSDSRFQYWGVDLGAGAQAAVRFYANDGLPSMSGPNMPPTLQLDSDWLSIVPTNRATLGFNDFVTGAAHPLTGPVPDDFTWTVQFRELGPSGSAGVDLYNPPTVGSDYKDYWYNDGTSWDLMAATNGTPVNFAAQIQAVPEPSVIWLSLLGALTVFGSKWRRARR